MPTTPTNLLGVAFTLLTTNYHSTRYDAVPCPYCTNTHHYMVVESHRINRETRVPIAMPNTTTPEGVLIPGSVVERVLEVTPLSAIYLTNYVSDLRAAQSRGRVPPMPTVPIVAGVHQLTNR